MAKKRSAAAAAAADAAARRRYHHRLLLRRAQGDNVLLPYEKPLSPELCPPASPSLGRLSHLEPPQTGLFRIFRNKVPGSGIPQNPSSEQHKSNLPIRVKIKVRSAPKVMPATEDDMDDEAAMEKRAKLKTHVGREIEYPNKCHTKGIIPPSTSIRNTTECETQGKILPTSRIGCTDLVDQPTPRLLELAEFCFPRKRGRDRMDAFRSKLRRHLEGPESMIKKGYWTSEDLKFLKTNGDDDECEEEESSINDQAGISKKKSIGCAMEKWQLELVRKKALDALWRNGRWDGI